MVYNQSPKILVIDDNAEFVRSMRFLCAEALSVEPHQINTARNLHEGLVLSHINIYDWVLLTVDPDHLGMITLARIAFGHNSDSKTQIAAFSYLSAKELAEEALAKGADCYLAKDDIDIKNLESILNITKYY